MVEIKLPASEEEIRNLKVGDEVGLTGTIITARDAAHKFMVEERPDFLRELLKGSVIYHCGPIMKKEGDRWSVVAAGPTTSIREEPYESTVIEEYGIAGVIGKGGMGPQTLKACSDHGAVYFHAVGGLAVILAKSVKGVKEVFMLEEFGMPEAMWVFEAEKLPVVVTMDSHGRSLHQEIEKESADAMTKVLEKFN
jgi:fumarate hydratase class I